MRGIELQLDGTTIRGPVEGPWEISSDRYRLTVAATPRGPAIAGWQAAGGPELVDRLGTETLGRSIVGTRTDARSLRRFSACTGSSPAILRSSTSQVPRTVARLNEGSHQTDKTG